MDYEKKYQEALKAAFIAYKNEDRVLKATLKRIFPELVESKDEKTRKEIISTIHLYYGEPLEDEAKEMIAWLEKQSEPQDKGEISDGYHTFNELYYYRMLYNAAFFNMLPKEWVHKSKKHHDGEECFGGGWFVVMANLPTGQISNHYELKDWNLFQIPEKEVADKWDGHTPQEAADRLHKYLLEKQGEQKPVWSEEDEIRLKHILRLLDVRDDKKYLLAFGLNSLQNLEKDIVWLKSLKSRYTWKPSELLHWKKSTLPNDNTTGFNSDYFCYKGYNINYKELFEKLPKDD